MSDIDPQILHSLFKLLNRSLLQYVSECYVWSDPESPESAQATKVIEGCVDRQKQHCALLAEPLVDAGYRLELGGYPTTYTDLHYVSLKFLLKELIRTQGQIVEELEIASKEHPDVLLLSTIAEQERAIQRDLSQLVQSSVVVMS